MRRSSVAAVASVMTLCLIATSPQRLVGDGREYLAQAINFASFHGPGLRPRDMNVVLAEMARFDPALSEWDIRGASVPDSRRSRDFPHFWFYSLLAAPGLWITRPLNLPPTLAFTAVNVLLFVAALWIALPRIGAAACLLLFASPVLWWIDKAHTEVFTFSLLTVAFALCTERPWWAMVAAGVAATQNPPIAVVAILIWITTVFHEHGAVTDSRIAAGAACALVLSTMHPLYTYVHHHTPSLLLLTTRWDTPGPAALTAVVLDPSIGLLGNYPLLLVVVMVAICIVLAHGASSPGRAMIVSSLSTVVFLIAFSRTTNVHHGGTPAMSRYAVWLIPPVVPLIAAAARAGTRVWPRFLWVTAVVSAAGSIVAFRPAVPENSREPTILATLLWTRAPAWNNPLAEVFSETELHVDDVFAPVTTAGCEKVLIDGSDGDGVWPIPCYPAPLPEPCTRRNTLCYANRVKHGYEFALAPGGRAATRRTDAVWPAAAEPHVRRLYDAWDWRTLQFDAKADGLVAEVTDASAMPIGSSDRFIVVLRHVRAGGRLRVRTSRPLEGLLVDAQTGARRLAECSRTTDGTCTIVLDHDAALLLLAMR